MLHFQKLDVYQRAIELLTVANRIRGRLPKGNGDLSDQLRRASQSIPQNIAEGCGRTARADKARHYTIARGSAMECAAHLDVMKLDELVEGELYERGVDVIERIWQCSRSPSIRDRRTASNTFTMSFPFPSAATITGATTATARATFTATIKHWCPFLRVAARTRSRRRIRATYRQV
jgi:four helix bundle protein